MAPSSFSRRDILANAAAGVALGTFGVPAKAQSDVILRPEDFGASGDGIAPDGPALARMIDATNAVDPSKRLTLLCRGQYLMRNAPPRAMGPAKHDQRPGDVIGLPPVTRNDVTVDARGAYFLVPPETPFRRIVRGGSVDDAFFVGWQFLGDRCSMIGGTLDGNLGQRPVERGPKPIGYGGADYGLIMEGEDWHLEGVTSQNWGTDCLFIASPGQSHAGVYSGARRNCVSIVANKKIWQDKPVIIKAGRVEHAADWPDHIYNNPGAGIVVEAGRYGPAQSTVHILGVAFKYNRLKDLQISKEAYRCRVIGNVFHNSVFFRPGSLGGHVLRNNDFHESANVQISQVVGPNEPIQITHNRCTCSKWRFINHRRSRVKNTHEWQAISLSGNEFGVDQFD